MSGEPKDDKPSQPMTPEIALEMLDGATYEQAAAAVAERVRVSKLARKVQGKPIEKWPDFVMQWDDNPSSFHFSQDGLGPGKLDLKEIGLFVARLSSLDAVLQKYNLRTPDEVWSVGDKFKAAKVIVHASEGRKFSPVWIAPTSGSEVCLVGGNHRLAIARAKGVETLPLIYHKKDFTKLKPLFPELSSD
ncbi:hypothetical protein [Rhodoplanes sp. Z2-YC6860]|uniref:hypothetical protein n=1 Tax=Rhodoplanes sp. Z2-YC6860 TaxID=674703 RepID=UPI00078C7EB8|nr:hypothetical protein [Rhodoplanes sp. Z2-YC6860]AMN45041.1 hypothetical protein RHPLAN_66350 [Rhodoplanes sp. Z2-YC6860]